MGSKEGDAHPILDTLATSWPRHARPEPLGMRRICTAAGCGGGGSTERWPVSRPPQRHVTSPNEPRRVEITTPLPPGPGMDESGRGTAQARFAHEACLIRDLRPLLSPPVGC